MADVLAAVAVVARHNRPGTALLHRLLEGRQIDLIQRPVVEVDIHRVTVRLLVVEAEMLDTGRNAVGLDTLDIRDDHLSGQVGILAHILEIAPAQRGAEDVDARPQQDILLPIAGFFTDRFAVEGRHIAVPGSRKAGQGREGHAGVAGPSGLAPFVPKDLGTDSVRAVGAPKLRNSQFRHAGAGKLALRVDHLHLLLYAQLPERLLDPPLRIVAGGSMTDTGYQGRNSCQPKNNLLIHILFHNSLPQT